MGFSSSLYESIEQAMTRLSLLLALVFVWMSSNPTMAGCDASAILVGNQAICEGEEAQFQIILTGEAPWTINYTLNGGTQEPIITSDAIHIQTWSQDGTYILTSVIDANCESEAAGVASLSVAPFPTATLIGDGQICGAGPDSLEVQLTGIGPWSLDYQIDGTPQGAQVVEESPYYIPVGSPSTYTLTDLSDLVCDQGILEGSVDVEFNLVEGGLLQFQGGDADTLVVCIADGASDDVGILVMNDEGDAQSFLVTQADSTILELTDANLLDFEGSAPGYTSLWSLSYLNGLDGLAEGNAIQDLSGCFDLSNPLVLFLDDSPGCVSGLSNTESLSFGLYPNPAVDHIVIEGAGFSSDQVFRVSDVLGRSVISGRLESSQRQSIDVSVLNTGTYFLEIWEDGGPKGSRTFVK